MYHYEHDARDALYVARFAGGGTDHQADFGEHLKNLRKALDQANAGVRKLALIIIFEGGHEVPNSTSRKEVAEFQKQPFFTPDVVLVSRNPLLRGVMTAIEWLRGGGVAVRPASTVEQAIEMLEKTRGVPLPGLHAMARRVERL